MAYVAINEDGTFKSSFAKFMKEEEMNALVAAMDGKPEICCSLPLTRIRWYLTFWATCAWNWPDSWTF